MATAEAAPATPPMDGSEDHPVMYFESDGSGPHYHVCAEVTPAVRVQQWLDRERMLGRLTTDQADVVERLIEDLR